MIDAFICTNLVNYTVASCGVRPGRARRALLLYEPARMARPRMPGVWTLPIGIWSLRLLRWTAALGLLHTLHVPHHRFNRRVAQSMRRARATAYLDDGLDTRRQSPRNFDLDGVRGQPPYYTFAEYASLPAWLARFDVRRCCSLQELARTSQRPALPLDDIDHVLVESPGLHAGDIIAGLALQPGRTLVVRHPIAAKRGALPDGCRAIEGHAHSLEASLLASDGKAFYFGETMALVFAALTDVARRNAVYAQLDTAQRANLVGLRWLDVAGMPVAGLQRIAAG
jgi:hypothetical protein